jgi:antitoxin Phd
MEWPLAEAKNKLSEVLNLAASAGPQRVRRRNDAFIVMREVEYERLAGKRPDFKTFLMSGESFDGLDLSRDQSLGRDIEL